VWNEYVYVVGVGDVLHAVEVACRGPGDHGIGATVEDSRTVSVDVGERSGERGTYAWQHSLPSALWTYCVANEVRCRPGGEGLVARYQSILPVGGSKEPLGWH
jgi:hypothetical protein